MSNLTTAATDTISVSAFNGTGCVAANQIGAGSATVTINPANSTKNLAAWLGQWTCTSQLGSGQVTMINIITSPYPSALIPYEPNSNYPPDLFIQYTNPTQDITLGAYYGFINTTGLNGWDARAPNAQAAYGDEYNLYTISGGTMTWSNVDQGVSKICNR